MNAQMSSRMKTTASVVAATAVATSATVLFGFGSAQATPRQTAPTAADAAFVTANEQSNLAEISLGTLAGKRGQDSATKTLASTTLSDHEKAKAKLTAAAASGKLAMPGAPNQMQLAVATQLKTAPTAAFDLMYAQAQVTAHTMALAGAMKELNSTQDAALKSYTNFYIGIATMHLHMAQAEVRALGGAPAGVPAGNAGDAATNGTENVAHGVEIGAGVVLVAAGVGLAARRRRSADVR